MWRNSFGILWKSGGLEFAGFFGKSLLQDGDDDDDDDNEL